VAIEHDEEFVQEWKKVLQRYALQRYVAASASSRTFLSDQHLRLEMKIS
jgi:hypothetical protein